MPLKLRPKKAINAKPIWRQTSEIRKNPALAAALRPLGPDDELSVVDYYEDNGHYYVVYYPPMGGAVESGWFWIPSVDLYDPDVPKYPDWDLSMDFPSRIVRYMMNKGWVIHDGVRHRNIIYIEGVEPSGKTNNDKLDGWNDVSCLLSFDEGKPYFAMPPVRATSEPGWKYTNAPLNRDGAFRIAFGQHFEAWQVGTHGYDYHPALQQSGDITGYRDFNKDGRRQGDKLYTVGPEAGVNHHGPYTTYNVGRSSAGCLVRSRMDTHVQFMNLIKKDTRYLANRWHQFGCTVIDGRDFAKSEWGYKK